MDISELAKKWKVSEITARGLLADASPQVTDEQIGIRNASLEEADTLCRQAEASAQINRKKCAKEGDVEWAKYWMAYSDGAAICARTIRALLSAPPASEMPKSFLAQWTEVIMDGGKEAKPVAADDILSFRKKPVVIKAVQWTGKNLYNVVAFTDGVPDIKGNHAGMKWDEYRDLVNRDGLKIYTLEGKMNADVGDWIIKGVKGEHYPCKPDVFELTYERAAAPQEQAPEDKELASDAIAFVREAMIDHARAYGEVSFARYAQTWILASQLEKSFWQSQPQQVTK